MIHPHGSPRSTHQEKHMKIKTKVRGGPRGCGPGGISIYYEL
ncbi:hypothetical protein ACLESO_39990 [Pyxidicoccus sp. 3LG]